MGTKTFLNENAMVTPEGGLAIKLTNKTGSASVKGTLVDVATGTENAFVTSAVTSAHVVGVVYDNGIDDGNGCFVVIDGIAQVLLKDTTAATKGYGIVASNTGGRADATQADPSGHWGWALESQTAGTDVLCRVLLRF